MVAVRSAKTWPRRDAGSPSRFWTPSQGPQSCVAVGSVSTHRTIPWSGASGAVEDRDDGWDCEVDHDDRLDWVAVECRVHPVGAVDAVGCVLGDEPRHPGILGPLRAVGG